MPPSENTFGKPYKLEISKPPADKLEQVASERNFITSLFADISYQVVVKRQFFCRGGPIAFAINSFHLEVLKSP